MPKRSPFTAMKMLALLFCAALASCSALKTVSGLPASGAATQGEHIEQLPDASIGIAEKKAVERAFEPETLYNLLIGELSVYNRDVRTAATFYHREAIRTREPQVVSRAARLARYLRDAEMATELAELWYEVEPDEPSAADNLADLYARSGRTSRALDILEAQMHGGQPARFGILRNNTLAAGSEELAEVLRRLENLSARAGKDNFSLLFTHALLLQKNGDNAAALKQIQRLRGVDSDPVQIAIIESQLQAELGNDKAATAVLRKALRKNPDDRNLTLAYARKLTKTDLPRAEKIFAELLENTPDDVTLLKSHALVAAENGNFERAIGSLQTLLDINREKSFAHYNLGLIAEARQDSEAALGFYEQVRPGDYFLGATQKLATLLSDRGQQQQARDYLASLRVNHPRQATQFWKMEADLLAAREDLNEAQRVLGRAIAQHPNDNELRFERSVLSEKLDDLDLVEYDLRYVLAREPNNPIALNALGYILADRTTRYAEALQLIEKALALKPGDPAIMDSLGWAQYKLGRNQQALENLQQAYAKFPDDEIAAHLIEVYWRMGQRGKAKAVYKQIRKQSKKHPLSDKTMQRLQLAP
ncbi:MAG: tetratricopeptide repeat protein [Gammaproteobacteria bacterium]|nr:tetratricopeptide repeat protein [Gammaproteobacteria bacterium]NND38162.1 tetratricopeptide repeat protein [Pseudomonadales bacterium]NNM11212.1 tetratricopeptide repeat protein [Pseudomonadales bacterium]